MNTAKKSSAKKAHDTDATDTKKSAPKSMIVAKWDLKDADETVPQELGVLNDTIGETVFDRSNDNRKVVSSNAIATDGKYRSIVKLFLQFRRNQGKGGTWHVATGWLIRDDLIVTAGHCLYDHDTEKDSGQGNVTRIKAYIGYNGRNSIGDDDVQFRLGSSVSTPAEWLESSDNRNYDIGFVELSKPFDGIRAIRYIDTPLQGDLIIGVVGYPNDKTYKKESAAQMYEAFQEQTFDIQKSKFQMLEYKIPTHHGNSGSPVLREDGVAIGTHVHNDKNLERNIASIIGPSGISYDLFKTVSRKNYPIAEEGGSRKFKGLEYIKIPTGKSPGLAKHRAAGILDELSTEWELATSLDSVAETELSLPGFPYELGPIAEKVVPLVTVLLQCKGEMKLAPGSEMEADEQDGIFKGKKPLSAIDRSILNAVCADACFVTWQQIASDFETGGWTANIKPTIDRLLPHVKKAVRKLMPQIKDLAFQVALDYINKHKSSPSSEREEEIGPLLLTGLNVVGSIVLPALAKKGVEIITGHSEVADGNQGKNGGQSGNDGDDVDSDNDTLFADQIAARISFAQACLEAFQQESSNEFAMPEIFKIIKDNAKGVWPIVEKFGPTVLQLAGEQVFKKVLKRKSGRGESESIPSGGRTAQKQPLPKVAPEDVDENIETSDEEEEEEEEEPTNVKKLTKASPTQHTKASTAKETPKKKSNSAKLPGYT